ncbi:ABC transporter substrate binding protein [Clostridium cochlearium]|uniref:ABC transporter substrate binding protein n=1 Tax=Clostridium cochlearium TaxID=1494 RepID=UPI001EDD3F39|nr:ABC transporter substrate binding protein [Clostridium cochlearium]MBV1820851.1 diguanylate cyclase [Bacteroidales bacterium MSK.15.36]MCG4581036.1 diguanylate cyclase [Clostridium cochlearium]
MKNKLKKIIVFIIIFFSMLINFQVLVKAEENNNVLILNSYSSTLQWTNDIESGVDSKLRLNDNILLYYESMDSKHNNSDEYIQMLYELYKTKYKGVKFDAIICSDNDALNFIVNYGEELFGECPVVFCGINDFYENILKGKTNFTGIIEKIDVESTIRGILEIQPGIKDIVIVCDSSITGKINERLARKAIEKINHNVKVHFCIDVKASEILNKVNSLGEYTAVLDIGQLKSEEGRYIPYEKTQNELAEFKTPIYVCWDFLLTDKIMGGKVIGGYGQGEMAAQMVLRILNGEDVKNIPLVEESSSNFVFNYNELKNHKITLDNLDKLDSDYLIINKPFSAYEAYKKEIITVIGIMIFLVVCIVILVINVKRRVLSEERYKLLAFYDQLTGLPNKHMFSERLYTELAKEEVGAVFFIDIDNFKSINDTLGHDYGDEFLKHISKEFLKILKHDELIYRLGGDEFIILRLGIIDYKDAEKTATKILNLFENPFNIEGRQIFTTASIGISMFPKDGLTKNELLKSADTAMYKAKEKGKNRYWFYDIGMTKDIMRKSELIDGLRSAILKSEFNLLYQPQVSLFDGKVKGAEVLIRWTSSTLGSISPAEFIPIAEQTEFIIPIGKWVLKKACIKNKEWIDKGLNNITVAVNVSVMQIHNDAFLRTIKEVLEEVGLPPEHLEIEITE